MPRLDAIVGESTTLITNVISEQIINRLLTILGLSSLFAGKTFIGTTELKSDSFVDENDKIRLSDNRCDVDVQINYNPMASAFEGFRSRDTDITISSHRNIYGEFPIFRDSVSDIYLMEVSVPCSVELKFELKLESSELAVLVTNLLFSKGMTSSSMYDYNNITYTYPIPDRFTILLHHMYGLREKAVANDTFQSYLVIGSNGAITTLMNRDKLASGSKELVVQRSHLRVLGRLEYAGEPFSVEDINKLPDRYSISFTYAYQFSRPALMRLVYPIMINNHLLERKYTRKPMSMNDGEGPTYVDDQEINRHLVAAASGRDLDKLYPLLRYPDYDDWVRSPAMYASINVAYRQLFIGLLSVTVDPTTGVASLTVDLKNEIFPLLDPACAVEIENVIKLADEVSIYSTDVLCRSSIFDIGVFSNDNPISFTDISISPDLVLTISSVIRVSRRYRIVISLIDDLHILRSEFIRYMIRNPAYYKPLIAENLTFLTRARYVKTTTNLFGEPVVTVTKLHDNIQSELHGGTPYHGTSRATTQLNFAISNRRNET